MESMPPVLKATLAKDFLAVVSILDTDPTQISARFETFGDQPLHLASWGEDLPMIELLLARGADVNAIGNHGWSPLHYAVYETCGNSLTVADRLIAAGADVNARDTNQHNVLDFAVSQFDDQLTDTIALLEQRGASPGLVTAIIRDDLELAKNLLSDCPYLTKEFVQSARRSCDTLRDPFSPRTDVRSVPIRHRFVPLLDGWLSTR